MAPRPESEADQVARMRRMYRSTLALWTSDYLRCRSMWTGPAHRGMPAWRLEPLIERQSRDAA